MGVGKTTVAEILKEKLALNVLDSDTEIERTEKKTILEIFKKGELFFRDLETKFLMSALHLKNTVLSVGGGIIEREKNLALLQNLGTVFFLELPLALLWQRIKEDKTRPKILDNSRRSNIAQYKIDDERRFLEFEKLYFSRLSQYKKADFTIFINKETAEQVADKIIAIYKNQQ